MTNRKSQLIDVVNRYGTISIHELQEIFNDVSAMTIRRDIESLEKDGKLIRIHGGAKSLNSIMRSDELYEIREVTNLSKKRIIAQKAAKLVTKGSTIYVNGGTTASELCKCLPDIDLRVYTDNIMAAVLMSYSHNITTILLGGTIDTRDLCTRHSSPESCWQDVNFTYAFYGVTGFSDFSGFTSGNDKSEYLLRKNIMRKSEKTVILIDSTKIGRSSCYTFANLSDVDIVITDDEFPPEIIEKFVNAGIEVL